MGTRGRILPRPLPGRAHYVNCRRSAMPDGGRQPRLPGAPPPHLAGPFAKMHPEVRDRFYGCGSPIPPDLTGATVLDLGCGSGRDCYVLSQLTGPTGRVIGVDMTDGQLAVARRHLGYHEAKFGFANVEFRQGFIEDLAGAGITDASVDVVVSNCVINLSPDKPRVFGEIFRVLKPGGELCFSDIFADRRLPAGLAADPVLLAECLAGAMYTEDFRRVMARSGCGDARPRSMSRGGQPRTWSAVPSRRIVPWLMTLDSTLLG